MAELITRVTFNRDKSGKIREGVHREPGDVIFVGEDGHPWSKAELNNPNWQIIKVPGIDAGEFTHLMEPVYDGDTLIAKNKVKLDPAEIPFLDKEQSSKADIDGISKTK